MKVRFHGERLRDRRTLRTSERFSEVTIPDYSTWLTKAQAADAIGVSTKTIEAFAKDAKIQQAAWRPAGRGPEKAVYNPDDVARIAQERRPGLPPFVLPAGSNGNSNGKAALVLAQPLEDHGAALVAALLAIAGAFEAQVTALRVTSQSSENSPKAAYVSKAEALALAGISAAELRRAVRAGEVRQRGRGYRRKDLEAL